MFFSRTCEYAIKIMIHLKAEHADGQWLGVKEVSKAIDSPEAFTAKILQQLVRAGLLDSMRGPNGGFSVNDPDGRMTLLQVVRAIDGDGVIRECVLGLSQCSSENPCAAHHQFVEVRDQLHSVLASNTLTDVAKSMKLQHLLLRR